MFLCHFPSKNANIEGQKLLVAYLPYQATSMGPTPLKHVKERT